MIKYILISVLLLPPLCFAGSGKLLGTSGLVQIEGSGGGGLVPWATLSGLDSDSEYSISPFFTRVSIQDFSLISYGVSASFKDQVEFSVTKHDFKVNALSTNIQQDVFGIKYRLYGDIVYSIYPQISMGIQHKRLGTPDIAQLLGASSDTHSTDLYIAATKVHLAGFYGYNVVWNLTARATRANELGLLGFGSDRSKEYNIVLEGSLGLVLRKLAFGIEYRQKPDNLGLEESDWKDVFISYFPNKHATYTLAYAELGSIAGSKPQSGFYLSIGVQF